MVGPLLTWLAGGSALAALVSILATVCAVILGLIYRRCVGILGADRRRPAERQAYDALRTSLAGGNLAARLYRQWLTTALDRVDHFFGDAGIPDRTFFPHAFGLRTPAPLWTVPALHRCLWLALIYPIVTILVVWALSGHVGPAETALHLQPNLVTWERWLCAVALGLSLFALWGAARTKGWKRIASTLACVGLFVAIIAFNAADLGTMTAGSPTVTYCIPGKVCSGTWTITILPPAVAVAVTVLGTVMVVGAVAIAGVVLDVIDRLSQTAGHRGHGALLSLWLLVMISTCLIAAYFLSALDSWQIAGPLLLFLGLLTLLNAPFDWISLGVTRALLRRGIEKAGWWPYFYALVDALLATVVIAALALTMVIGVQAFDNAAVSGGGTAVLPLQPLFAGITTHPTAPGYWWLYVLLLSTMIPSFANLVIGGTSLLRGLPVLPALLLRSIPAQANVPKWDRAWIAAVLTFQVATGAALGIAMQVVAAVIVIGYLMPLVGLGLLDMARDVASLNLPMRAWQLFGHLL